MKIPAIFWSLDIETLGTTIDSAVTQIGLALFEHRMEGYHCTQRHTLNVHPEEYGKRHIDPKTIAWYQENDLKLPTEPYLNRVQALWTFTEILASVGQEEGPVPIFAKGPHFDFAILGDFFGGEPWHYRAPRDFRTVVMLSATDEKEMYEDAAAQQEFDADFHDAGYDAYVQGVILTFVFDELNQLELTLHETTTRLEEMFDRRKEGGQ